MQLSLRCWLGIHPSTAFRGALSMCALLSAAPALVSSAVFQLPPRLQSLKVLRSTPRRDQGAMAAMHHSGKRECCGL
ncbi:hypothetical protein BDV10DRAFT_105030 [Aspergillus recurvatus]